MTVRTGLVPSAQKNLEGVEIERLEGLFRHDLAQCVRHKKPTRNQVDVDLDAASQEGETGAVRAKAAAAVGLGGSHSAQVWLDPGQRQLAWRSPGCAEAQVLIAGR